MAQFEHKAIRFADAIWKDPQTGKHRLGDSYHPESGEGFVYRPVGIGNLLCITKRPMTSKNEGDFTLIDLSPNDAKALRDALNEFIAEAESAEVKA